MFDCFCLVSRLLMSQNEEIALLYLGDVSEW